MFLMLNIRDFEQVFSGKVKKIMPIPLKIILFYPKLAFINQQNPATNEKSRFG